jgi:hypothetical protein
LSASTVVEAGDGLWDGAMVPMANSANAAAVVAIPVAAKIFDVIDMVIVLPVLAGFAGDFLRCQQMTAHHPQTGHSQGLRRG